MFLGATADTGAPRTGAGKGKKRPRGRVRDGTRYYEVS